jgi:hypothetical protein
MVGDGRRRPDALRAALLVAFALMTSACLFHRRAPARCSLGAESVVEVISPGERRMCFASGASGSRPDPAHCLPSPFHLNDRLSCGWDDHDTIWVSSVDIGLALFHREPSMWREVSGEELLSWPAKGEDLRRKIERVANPSHEMPTP